MNRITTISSRQHATRLAALKGARSITATAATRAQDKENKQEPDKQIEKQAEDAAKKPKKKTMAELDEEMRLAMEGHAGDGGSAGLELEGGKAVSMKRGVRENMFRYI